MGKNVHGLPQNIAKAQIINSRIPKISAKEQSPKNECYKFLTVRLKKGVIIFRVRGQGVAHIRHIKGLP